MSPTLRHLGLIVLACILVYSNTLSNGFHLDDAYRVESNPGVQQFWSPLRHFTDPGTSSTLPRIVQYRPLLPLSLSINHAIAGDSLWGYHLGNILLQLLASVLLYFLVRELLGHWADRHGERAPAITPVLVAVLFAVHPVSGITVNYVCSRDLSMTVLFMTGSLLAYARMRRLGDTPLRWASCIGLLLLALLAKKNAVAFPALVLLFDLLVARDRWTRAFRFLAFALTILGYLAFVRYGLGFSDLQNVVGDRMGWLEYATAQLQHHTFFYARNFAWPFPIRPAALEPVVAWKVVAGAVVLLASWVLAAYWWRRRPLLALCILGYQALLAVTSSVLPLHDDVVLYRPYPSGPFLFLGLALWLSRFRRGTVILGAAVVYAAVASFAMNPLWKDEQTLWRHAIRHGGKALAHYNLAASLPDDHPEKLLHYDAALAQSPNYILAFLGKGLTRIRTGDIELGMAEVRHAVDLDPSRAQSHYWHGFAAHLAGREDEAADAAARAAERQAGNDEYLYFAAESAYRAGTSPPGDTIRARSAEMLRFLTPLVERRGHYRDAVFYLAFAHQQLGDHDRALTGYQRWLERHPDSDSAYYNIGLLRITRREWQQAVESFHTCLQKNPKNIAAHLQLAICYRELGDTDKAAHHQGIYDRGG